MQVKFVSSVYLGHVVDKMEHKKLLFSKLLLSCEAIAENDEERYLRHEIERYKFFLVSLFESKTLDMLDYYTKKSESNLMLDFICPVLRLAIEGLVKTIYLLSWKQRGDSFENRLEILSSNFHHEYALYSKHATSLRPSLKKYAHIHHVDPGRKKIKLSIRDMLIAALGEDDLDRGAGDNKVHLINNWYSFCSIYAHGSINPVIAKTTEIKDIIIHDIKTIIEQISEYYFSFILLRSNSIARDFMKEMMKDAGLEVKNYT